MDVVVHIPDDASLDAAMNAFNAARAAFMVGYHKSEKQADSYMLIVDGNVFHSEKEYDDWRERVKKRDENLAADPGYQERLWDGAIDVREVDGEMLKSVGLFINEMLGHPDKIGPTSVMHKLSGLLDYGIQKAEGQDALTDDVATIVPADDLPLTGEWTVNEAKSIKMGNWDWMSSPSFKQMEELLAAIRG